MVPAEAEHPALSPGSGVYILLAVLRFRERPNEDTNRQKKYGERKNLAAWQLANTESH